MKKDWQTKTINELFLAIIKIKNKKQASAFFRDLCTIEELEEMSRRWQAARMLDQNKPYREIAKKTGLSTTTVTRVAYWLNRGEGGYRSILNKI